MLTKTTKVKKEGNQLKLSKKLKKGFTLAETLITLSIIGVIGALTVPDMITNARDKAAQTAFLETYRIIQDAYTSSRHSGIPFWDPTHANVWTSGIGYGSANWTINPIYIEKPDYLKNFFKIAQGHWYKGGGAATWAIGDAYRGSQKSGTATYNTEFSKEVRFLDNTSANDLLTNGTALAFKLENGAIVGFYIAHFRPYMIYIDANGSSEPNVVGRDIFLLQASYNWNLGYYQLFPYGHPRTGDSTKVQNGSSAELADDCYVGGKGQTCAYKVVSNKGYKIPKRKPTP